MEIHSPMAGILLRISAQVGDQVQVGQEVAVLESMKMEVPVTAETAGEVVDTPKEPGSFVQEGDVLVVLR